MDSNDSTRTLRRVVLVEDDPLLLCSFADSLRELGYDVRKTTDPAEALRWIERDGADALFTDINMPGMDGRDLAAQARRSVPKLRVVFATGYSVAKVPDLDDARYLRKPSRLPRRICRRRWKALSRRSEPFDLAAAAPRR